MAHTPIVFKHQHPIPRIRPGKVFKREFSREEFDFDNPAL